MIKDCKSTKKRTNQAKMQVKKHFFLKETAK